MANVTNINLLIYVTIHTICVVIIITIMRSSFWNRIRWNKFTNLHVTFRPLISIYCYFIILVWGIIR